LLPSLLWPSLARAADHGCQHSPDLIGKCHIVKGSLGLSRGQGVTLLGDDGNITLIRPPPGSNTDIAPKVMQNWEYWQSRTHDLSIRLQGEYRVCPLPPEAGLEKACITDGRRFHADPAQ
jgi:hypothetical protein